MNKKWMPHIIAAGVFAVFIVLGLACATTPNSQSVTFPPEFVGTWRRDNFNNTLTFSAKSFTDSAQPGLAANFVRISGDLYTCAWANSGREFTLTFIYINGNLEISGDSGTDERNWNGTWKKLSESELQALQQQQQQAQQQIRQDALSIIGRTSGRTPQECVERGFTAFRVKLYDLAIREYSEAIYLTPNHPLPFFLRADPYRDKGDFDAAIADYSQAILLHRDSHIPPYRSAQGTVMGSPTMQILYSVSSDGSHAIGLSKILCYAFRGRLYGLKGEYDLSIADLTEALRLEPNGRDTASHYNNRGVSYFGKGDYDSSIADFIQAIQRDRNNNTYYSNRGQAYHEKQDYDKAIEDYTQALRLDSNNARVFNWRGLSYEGKKAYFQAISDFTQAARLDPVNAEYGGNLERVRQLQGRQ